MYHELGVCVVFFVGGILPRCFRLMSRKHLDPESCCCCYCRRIKCFIQLLVMYVMVVYVPGVTYLRYASKRMFDVVNLFRLKR